MARRIDIELTSSRDDGTWTWRAAGAKEPRGVVDEKLLVGGARVGDVLRVEAEFGLDGINVLAVVPPKERSSRGPTIEIETRRVPGAGSVTASLQEKRQRRSGGFDGERRGSGPATGRGERGAARRGERTETAGPPHRGRRPDGAGGHTGAERTGAERTAGRAPGAGAPARPAGTERAAPARPGRTRPPRVVPRSVHRDALLDTLPVEQRPIAEQLAAGGLPAVRRALAEQRATARAEGRPEAAGEAIVALAEQLLPRVKEATWRDRAEAVAEHLETVALRDLRAVVTSATARDESARALLARLKEALDARVTKLRATWEHDVAHALEEGRVLQALRLSARTPEPTARFPASLVQPLAEATGAALTATTPPERWLALLEAAAASPVRRAVRPAGVPSDEGDRTRKAAAAFAGRIPALAALLGLTMPPPPRPLPATAHAPAGAARPIPSPTPEQVAAAVPAGGTLAPAEVAPAEVAPAEVAPAEVAPAEVAPAEVAPAQAPEIEAAAPTPPEAQEAAPAEAAEAASVEAPEPAPLPAAEAVPVEAAETPVVEAAEPAEAAPVEAAGPEAD